MLGRLAMTVALAVGAALSPITAAATAASTQPEHFVGVESTAGDEVNRYGRLQVDTFTGEELGAATRPSPTPTTASAAAA